MIVALKRDRESERERLEETCGVENRGAEEVRKCNPMKPTGGPTRVESFNPTFYFFPGHYRIFREDRVRKSPERS